MARFWTPPRRDQPELMDAPGLPEAEVADAYRVLGRINRQLGNLDTLRREFRRFLAEPGPGGATSAGPSILDVGTGSGDLPAALLDLAGPVGLGPVVALDRDPTACRASRARGLDALRADALRLPFADRSIDLVTAVKFAHHFAGPALRTLLAEMARVARRRVVVLDIRRHLAAYWGFRAWSLAFTRNRLVRYDGPLSVLRGFTDADLLAAAAPIAGFRWEVRRHLGFQLALIGRREAEG